MSDASWRKGFKVVLLERNICGGSSTGKSAGFLTPDSELELSQILRRYGKQGALDLWGTASYRIDLIAATVPDSIAGAS
jgi:gamma-glutamylputrescine oxidase